MEYRISITTGIVKHGGTEIHVFIWLFLGSLQDQTSQPQQAEKSV
jgi:hypothetical protein